MNVHRLPRGFLALGLFLLCACEHYMVPERGKAIVQTDLAKIIKGQTTKREIRAQFGRPDSNQMAIDMRSVWQYCHSAGAKVDHLSIQGQSYDKRKWNCLFITFSPKGVVEDYVVKDFNEPLDETDKREGLKSFGNVQLYP